MYPFLNTAGDYFYSPPYVKYFIWQQDSCNDQYPIHIVVYIYSTQYTSWCSWDVLQSLWSICRCSCIVGQWLLWVITVITITTWLHLLCVTWGISLSIHHVTLYPLYILNIITLKWFWRALSLVWEPTWAVWSLKWLFEARACSGFKLSLKASKSLRRLSNKMIIPTKIILLLLIIHRSPPYVGFN